MIKQILVFVFTVLSILAFVFLGWKYIIGVTVGMFFMAYLLLKKWNAFNMMLAYFDLPTLDEIIKESENDEEE